jgi:hypothetical protein
MPDTPHWADITAVVLGSITVFGGAIAFMWAFTASARDKWSLFQLRFLDPSQTIHPEDMQEFAVLKSGVGNHKIRIAIRPRKGLTITGISPAFFERSKNPIPRAVGKRRSPEEINATEFRVKWGLTGTEFCPTKQNYSEVGAVWCKDIELGPQKRVLYEFNLETITSINRWLGIFSFEVQFRRGGDPDNRRIRVPVYVDDSGRLPLRWVCRRLMRSVIKISPLPQPSYLPTPPLGGEESVSERPSNGESDKV